MKINFFNKIKYIALLGVLLSSLISCEGDFLNTDPTDRVSTDAATGTADNLMLIINGMHRNMYVRQNSSQGQIGQTGVMIMMDALGDDLVFPSTGNGWYISTVRWQDQNNPNGSNLYYPYQFYYSMIKNANAIILNYSKAKGDANVIKKAAGEAYAYRAFCYFNLVQLYGKRYVAGQNNSQLGVPLRLDESYNPLKRSTVEEVYNQINSDLDNALMNLDGQTRFSKSHFNVNVVKGLIARVALTQGNYVKAATYAKEARTGFSLMSTSVYKAGFNNLEGNGEWMWGSQINEDQSEYFGNFGAYMSRNYSSTNIRTAPKAMSKKLFDKFPSSDVRTQVVDPTGAHTALGLASNFSKYAYTSQKFLAVSASDSRMDVPYMRAAEMYLIEAEALARQGKESESKIVFNALETARNPSYVATTLTGEAYIQRILDSRRIELWGEGFRFFDLKRLNVSLDRTGSNFNTTVVNNVLTIPSDDKRWTYLIPQSEINANPLCEQNEL